LDELERGKGEGERMKRAPGEVDAGIRAVAPTPFVLSVTVVVFSLALLQSAFLLFCVQPMIARMVLPLLGGSPAVWSTCMVFFQACLIAGYGYAHATTLWLGLRGQVLLHAGLVLGPCLVLPVRVG
jgi:hypothetical protein